jgi:molybdopterin-containing oxidoreductase family iron-sulfur binding subunit
MSKESKDNSRRNFLKAGLGLGLGSIIGLPAAAQILLDNDGGEKVSVLTTDGKVVKVNTSALDHSDYIAPPIGKEARQGIPDRKFVMVIDLAQCGNARKCIEKCQSAHHLPPDQEFMKVYKMKDSKNTSPYWFPKPCYHCDNPACVEVCPVEATFKRTDGIVLIDNEKCIGCKYCMVACPYSARTFVWSKSDMYDDVETGEYSPETSIPPKVGTVSKCDFCPDMSRMGKLPHCVSACPMGAIYFGDLNEDTVTNSNNTTLRFSELMKDKAGYRYLDHLGMEPNVYYLPAVDRAFDAEQVDKNE